MNAKLESNIKQAIKAFAWFRELAPCEHANGVDAERYRGFTDAPFYAPLLNATRGETVIEDGEFMEGATLPEQMLRGLLHSQKVALASEVRVLLESFLTKLYAWRNDISERVEEYRWETCDIRTFTADSDMRTVLGHEHQETLEGMRVESQRIVRLLRLVLSILNPDPIDDDDKRRQEGVDAWNARKTWREVAELLEGTSDIDQSDIARIKGEVTRFAKRTEQVLRKSSPGKKRGSKSNE